MIDRINERWSVDCSSLVDTSGYQYCMVAVGHEMVRDASARKQRITDRINER